MKNIILPIVLLFATLSFSQNITVTTKTYTIQQLVNNVLINTPCVSGTNITSRTGTNFDSSNGIGYFQNTNPNFPIQSGVILSTGSAVHASGPNNSLLNDGSSSWVGDADLEATLAQSGINMTSTNASVLEFDFTPISSHFSFDFVFASEEYGNFQCQFSDAFSFLLTNLNTGVTTNLAVVPGTTLPISVVTIRDYLYNSSCPSVNAQYFGNYNGGSAANGSATNFNGQTVLMSASSVLIPNTPYHIKLVIADRNDFQSDSAIFLKSNSFNIGQDVLGADLTVQNNSAICYSQPYTITSGLNPSNYTFIWTKNGVTIPNETGANLTVTLPGIYGVTYNKIINPCEAITDTITVEYLPELSVTNPVNLFKCPSSTGNYSYLLGINNSVVLTGQVAGTTVRYFNTLSNAVNNINPILTGNNYLSTSNETIYVRVTNPITHCFAVKSFQLLLTVPPVANQPSDLTLCETNRTAHTASFNINNQTTSILNGQSSTNYSVSYYTTLADANAGTNAIPATSYTATNGTIIYAKVKSKLDGYCFSITSFTLFVNPKPEVDTLPNVLLCDNYVLPVLVNGNYFTATNGGGTPLFAGDVISQTKTIYIYTSNGLCSAETSFKIQIINLNTLTPGSKSYCDSYILPSIEYASYYTQPNAGGIQLHPGDLITSTQTIYLYYISLVAPFCVVESNFTVTIINSPSVSGFTNVFACNSYALPTLVTGKYYTASNGVGTELPAGALITTTQKIYVFATTNTTPKCTSEDSFMVTIGLVTVSNITDCVSYTLPPLTVGNYYTGINGTGTLLTAGTVINTTQTIHVYAVSQDGCANDVTFEVTIILPFINPIADVEICSSYTLPILTVGNYYTGSNGTGTMLNSGDVITNNIDNLYIYVSNGAGCQNQKSFNITIKQLPQIDSRSNIDICGSYTLTSLSYGKYFTGTNGTGTELLAGTIITTSQTIYIYASSATAPFCAQENSFTIHVYSVLADALANVVACDSYTLPVLTNGKYYTNTGGQLGAGTLLLAGQTINTNQTIFVYNESGERINCSAENSFTVTINHTPVIAAVTDINACDSYTLPVLVVGNYYTQSGGIGTMLHAGDVITSEQTIYVYAHSATSPNCTSEKSFKINFLKASTIPNVTSCSYVLPNIAIGNYYTGPNATGAMLPVGTMIFTTQKIYIHATSPLFPSCSSENSFTVTIANQPKVNTIPIANRSVCDTDGTNDGITNFDLTTLNAIVLGNQSTSLFNIAYFENIANASSNINAINNTNLKTVYVRVTSIASQNTCFDVKEITLIVNKLPVANPKGGFICINNQTGTVLNPYTIDSELSINNNAFVWTNENNNIVGNNSVLQVSTAGNYSLVVTDKITGCVSKPQQVTVNYSQKAIVKYTTNEAFSENQSITVTATGDGEYEYQLDDNDFQDENIFENVNQGPHTINVHDKYGCGNSTLNVFIINYPKFFTPNGDGANDTWNIYSLEQQPKSKIIIYDRFGKILKSLTMNGNSWDGTLNGQPLPSDDYWFTISYIEDGATKEFKSHFSLIR
jgi:gliding motility-associated-like protein